MHTVFQKKVELILVIHLCRFQLNMNSDLKRVRCCCGFPDWKKIVGKYEIMDI